MGGGGRHNERGKGESHHRPSSIPSPLFSGPQGDYLHWYVTPSSTQYTESLNNEPKFLGDITYFRCSGHTSRKGIWIAEWTFLETRDTLELLKTSQFNLSEGQAFKLDNQRTGFVLSSITIRNTLIWKKLAMNVLQELNFNEWAGFKCLSIWLLFVDLFKWCVNVCIQL